MNYKLSKSVHLSDYANGRLRCRISGMSVDGSEIHRQVALHFKDPASWDTYPDKGSAAAQAFADLCEAKMILKADATRDPGLVRPETTMFEVPFRALKDISEGEIVFVGAPLDIGTTGYPGARYGPDALRAASVERFQCQIDLKRGTMIGWNAPSLGGGILDGARLSDAGDVPYEPGEPAENYYQRLRDTVGQIFRARAFPVVLGGDHSITYATVPDEPAALVHLDAHCDLAERVEGHCHHHGNFLRRLLDEDRVSEVHHLGLRETAGWDTLNAGTSARSVGDLEVEDWPQDIAGKTCFVSLDVDVLDPSVLPATGTPVIGGLTLRQLCQVLALIAQVSKPVGLDIVELCPIRDDSGLSERSVIEALLCFLAVLHAKTSPQKSLQT